MYQKSRRRLVIPFLLPAFVLYTFLRFVPLIQTAWGSLTNWQGHAGNQEFWGLRNYTLMFMDPQFVNAAKNTVLFAVGGGIILFIPAIFMSWALTQPIKSRGVFRYIIIAPHMLSVVAVGLLWRLLYNPIFGPINNLLKAVGLKSWALSWLGDSRTALMAIVLAATWATLGMWVLLISASLERVPQEVLEAARIDGSNEWHLFWKVTMPLVWGALRLLFILWIIRSLQNFAWIFVMSGTMGRPLQSTNVLATLMYDRAFSSYQWGLACAIATFMLLAILFLTLFVNWLTKRDVIEY